MTVIIMVFSSSVRSENCVSTCTSSGRGRLHRAMRRVENQKKTIEEMIQEEEEIRKKKLERENR